MLQGLLPVKTDSVIARVRFRDGRELTGCLPVKFSTVDDDTADCGSMSANEFCCRMNNNVCAVFDRPEQIRGCKCIVHNKWNFMRMGDLCDCLNVADI